jgi:hypothetical protein
LEIWEDTLQVNREPQASEITNLYLTKKFGVINEETRYPVKGFLQAILSILVEKHRDQNSEEGSFNQLLLKALILQEEGGLDHGETC